MKANEAPEKIFVHVRANKELGTTWHGKKITNGDIEYVRTDVFIEKACEWLSDNLQTIVDVDHPSKHHVESIPVLGSITQTEFLEKFMEEIKYLFD